MYMYICSKCSKEFYTKNKNQRFCSKSCANSQSSKNRKIQENSIFQSQLNETSAYILGLIISDGCISYDNHCKRYKITISMNDFYLIEFLRSRYSPTKKLYEYKNKKGNSITYTFISTNEYDVKYLNDMNINERKSNNVRLPFIEDKYISHMIRGIFDGDGSVYINKTKSNGILYKYLNVSFTTGSEKFAQDIIEVLKGNDICAHKVKDSRKATWYVKIYSKSDVKKLSTYLYNNADLYMQRKKNLFNMMI